MADAEIRWMQRFDNFKRAHLQFKNALQLMRERSLSDLEKQGLIQAFEFTYELAWNLLRDYIVWQGDANLAGSRDTFREAFKRDLIKDGHAWMAMLQDRNRTVHTYNESTANEIISQIELIYAGLFSELELTFNRLNISD
ncbi:nucleotidyltransferase [Nitrincola tibetensis]|uniref:Nucleotidyltransferase n=1 Tax=Nitrincola tibetensis TaxID=2219697 RepID=A0A364NQ25_9GAMM|nr:nucleotidyltransferase substrate binding protein [Nitrincola tibetensis]RAU19208.1 nucleotidyltransferase [Nitrincola tibetensis]